MQKGSKIFSLRLAYANKNPAMGFWVIVEHCNIGNTCILDILRNAKTSQKEYEFFKGYCWKLRHLNNEVLMAWYKKCASACDSRWPNAEGRSNFNKREINQRWFDYVPQ